MAEAMVKVLMWCYGVSRGKNWEMLSCSASAGQNDGLCVSNEMPSIIWETDIITVLVSLHALSYSHFQEDITELE